MVIVRIYLFQFFSGLFQDPSQWEADIVLGYYPPVIFLSCKHEPLLTHPLPKTTTF